MTFNDAYELSDAIISEKFQTGKTRIELTQQEIDWVNITQKYGLTLPYTEEARKLLISKLFEQSLNLIQLFNQSQD
jgi:hypothetical protein